MSLQALYAAFSLLGLVAEIALFVVLIVRRQYKVFPVFTFYIAFSVLNDIGMARSWSLPDPVARSVAFGLLPLQYLLELGVLFEIAWHVLRPVHASLPARHMHVFIGAVALALIGGILLAWHLDNTGNKVAGLKVPLDLTVGLLRMMIFVATAGFAQLLGIGWKNKVLQLATALSFYSAVDLIVSLVERYSGGSNDLDGFGWWLLHSNWVF